MSRSGPHTLCYSAGLLAHEAPWDSVPGDIIIVEKCMCADSCSLTLKLKVSLPVSLLALTVLYECTVHEIHTLCVL